MIALVITLFKRQVSIWSQFLTVVMLYMTRKWKHKLKFSKMASILKKITVITVREH